MKKTYKKQMMLGLRMLAIALFFSITLSAEAADTTNPTVTLTAPVNGATVSGVILVTADAADDVEVSKVSLYVDDAWKMVDHGFPYEFSFNTSTLTVGDHLIKVRAVDTSNNFTETSNITVTVTGGGEPADTTNPTITLTSPVNGDTVSGTILVTADATDDIGVTKVSLWVNDGYVDIDFSAPYEFSYDTSTLAAGDHLIKVKAVDTSDNSTTTSNITVTVSAETEVFPSKAEPSRLFMSENNQPEIRIDSDAAFTNDLKIYHRVDLLEGEWNLVSHITPSAGSTNVSWVDTNTTATTGYYFVEAAATANTNTSGLAQVDIRTRARLLGYLFAEGSCANPNDGGDKFIIGVKNAQNERALWCAQEMEDAGLLTIVSHNENQIKLTDLPWDIPYANVTWNTDIYMTFDKGLPEDPDNPGQWALEVYNSHFIAAIIEGEGLSNGLIDDQFGWGDHTPHITELHDLLNEPEYDCDAYLEDAGKKVKIAANKFYIVREFEYVFTTRVPGGSDGLVIAPTPPEYATP